MCNSFTEKTNKCLIIIRYSSFQTPMWKHTILLIEVAGINHRNVYRPRTSWGNLPCVGMKLGGPFYHPCWRTEKEKTNTANVLLTVDYVGEDTSTSKHLRCMGTFNIQCVKRISICELQKKRGHVKPFPQYFAHGKIFLHSMSALTLNSSTLKSVGLIESCINERRIWPLF